MADEELRLLCNAAKIDRDRGLAALKRRLIDADCAQVSDIEDKILLLLVGDNVPWETWHGAMGASKLVLSHQQGSDDFSVKVHELIVKALEHKESRVRIIAGMLFIHIVCILDITGLYSTV